MWMICTNLTGTCPCHWSHLLSFPDLLFQIPNVYSRVQTCASLWSGGDIGRNLDFGYVTQDSRLPESGLAPQDMFLQTQMHILMKTTLALSMLIGDLLSIDLSLSRLGKQCGLLVSRALICTITVKLGQRRVKLWTTTCCPISLNNKLVFHFLALQKKNKLCQEYPKFIKGDPYDLDATAVKPPWSVKLMKPV